MSTVIKGGTVVTADLTYVADVLIEGGYPYSVAAFFCCVERGLRSTHAGSTTGALRRAHSTA